MRTVDSIMSYFHKAVQEKKPLAPAEWVEGAQYANVLMGDETDKLFELQQEISRMKNISINTGDSVAKAKVMVEATEEYKNYCKQKAKIDQVTEFIRIAKLMSRMSNEEFKHY